jgi:hypothetical protein
MPVIARFSITVSVQPSHIDVPDVAWQLSGLSQQAYGHAFGPSGQTSRANFVHNQVWAA